MSHYRFGILHVLAHEQILSLLGKLACPGAYLVAYSGGLDSHVLLNMMAALRERLDAPVQAIHIQHGLQAQAAQWAEHCATVCQELQIPLITRHLNLQSAPGVNPGTNLEAVARNARYAAFAGQLPDQGMLLTAHHADDQAETLLLQLLRGAGIEGLAAMPTSRRWHNGWHTRPLLDYARAELQAYAEQHQLNWVEDPSNQNTDFDRNYLRHQIMPLLQVRWPAANRTVARSAGHLAALLPIVQQHTDQALQQCLNPSGRLLISELKKLDEDTQRRVIRAWVQRANHTVPHFKHVMQIQRQLLYAKQDGAPEVCWNNSIIRRYRNALWLDANQAYPPPNGILKWPDTPELELPAGCGRLVRQPTTDRGIPDRLWKAGKINIRWRNKGVTCQPQGRQGHRSFKKLCQDFAIPPWRRPYLPLIYADDQLIGMADYCVCENIQTRPEDKLSRLVYQHF